MQPRYAAFLVHLGLSLLVLGGLSAIVRMFWYPGPYFRIAGVDEVLLILLVATILLGPLLTFLVFDRRYFLRQPSGLGFDMVAIALIQGTALAYGGWALAASRPALTIFDDGFFQVSSWAAAKDSVPDELQEEQTRPVVVWARPGAETAARDDDGEAPPTRYERLKHAADVLVASGKSVSKLMERDARVRREITRLLPDGGEVPESWRIYPVYGHRDGWSAVVDTDDASVVGFVHAHSRWIREGGTPRAAPPPKEVAQGGRSESVAGR